METYASCLHVIRPREAERKADNTRSQTPNLQPREQTTENVGTTSCGTERNRDNANTMIEPSLRLRRAIHSADTLLVARILRANPSLLQNPDTSPSGLSNTNLHLAASLGHTSIVSLLLSLYRPASSPPTTNPRDPPALSSLPLNEEYQTPLHLASANGHTEIAHLLCAACPNCIKRGDVRGRDALMLASQAGHDTVVQILLTFSPSGPEKLLEGADVDGNTALHFASSNGHSMVLRTLLAAGADSEKRNVWSWTPVAYSATVQAEVYFKGLVAEVERRRQVGRQAREKGTGGAVRVVNLGEGGDDGRGA